MHPSLILSIRVRSAKSGASWCAPVVSKKIYKSAVARNKLKRWIREAGRAYQKKHPSPPSVFVYARVGMRGCSFVQMQQAFFELMPAHI